MKVTSKHLYKEKNIDPVVKVINTASKTWYHILFELIRDVNFDKCLWWLIKYIFSTWVDYTSTTADTLGILQLTEVFPPFLQTTKKVDINFQVNYNLQ